MLRNPTPDQELDTHHDLKPHVKQAPLKAQQRLLSIQSCANLYLSLIQCYSSIDELETSTTAQSKLTESFAAQEQLLPHQSW